MNAHIMCWFTPNFPNLFRATKMCDECLILHPENGGTLQLLRSLFLAGNEHDFVEYSEHFRPRHRDQNKWIIKISILVLKLFHSVAKPMAWVGFCIEFMLNLLSDNGGFTGLICKVLKGDGVIKPKRGTENFISAIGYLDGRLDLDHSAEKIIKSGSRYCADICIMASKLAYENESLIKNVVTNHWKMHFVEFFSCWNQFLKKKSTHAFIFCDKAENAELVVIAFRGTEPFDAIDWSTDFDISLYKMEPIGRTHLGFLEAMGLANRSNKQVAQFHLKPNTSDGLPDNVPEDHEKPLAYYAIRERLEKLLEQHKDAKYIVTGHSLGGALAVMFPTILLLHNRKKLLEKLLAVYTFGQPRVGDEQMGKYMNKNINEPEPRYYRVVYSNDLIPRLPYDNKMFLFKHFGACIYYSSCYKQKTLKEEPNRNFSLLYYIPNCINAIWELIQSFMIRYTKGNDFREGWCGIVFRCMGIVLPGISAHSPVNYINAIRLGPPSFHAAVTNRISERSIQMDGDQYHHHQN
ncbi:triacylglycerol lipase OBL1 [Cryptomeria japonica]|uniref:triacylglycerol lipase OBL1 n=1 Tax=Cryptomeria japonica TaxID=3369 RepID=UPI0027DA7EA8|nr:triacylglycerol lipase OBL1 [Cryptomeria japonica]